MSGKRLHRSIGKTKQVYNLRRGPHIDWLLHSVAKALFCKTSELSFSELVHNKPVALHCSRKEAVGVRKCYGIEGHK